MKYISEKQKRNNFIARLLLVFSSGLLAGYILFYSIIPKYNDKRQETIKFCEYTMDEIYKLYETYPEKYNFLLDFYLSYPDKETLNEDEYTYNVNKVKKVFELLETNKIEETKLIEDYKGIK